MKKSPVKFSKKYLPLLLIFLIPLIIYFPSFSGFFTNDEFFLLKTSGVSTFWDLLKFFNPIHDYFGLGAYRPLTLGVYYFVSAHFFGGSALPLRVLLFIVFYANVLLVWKLADLISDNKKIAISSAFLYAMSASHFGHLYYTGCFQDTLASLFFFSSVYFFIKYEREFGRKHSSLILFFSLAFFTLTVMSKEIALVLPLAIVVTDGYLRSVGKIKIPLKKFAVSLIPFMAVLVLYAYFHFFTFGLLKGDSYVWDFSVLRAVNTTAWYFLWSLNIPETLVDFVGPGIRINPNLMKYWSAQMIPIFVLFAVQFLLAVYAVFKSKIHNQKSTILFSVLWFILTLLPVVFLPLHKFTFYLAVPLFGVVYLIASALVNLQKKQAIFFCVVWTLLSFCTVRLTAETNWITRGMQVSRRVYEYFGKNQSNLAGKDIVFTDSSEDVSLPWSPTETLKTVLAGRSFFDVYYPEFSDNIFYGEGEGVKIKSRMFLGY